MFLILNTLILLSKNKFIKISRVIFSSLFIISFYISISNLDDLFGNKLFSNISIKPVVRNDYNNIGNLVNYLILNTNGEDKIYPNFATAKYCGDTLIYYLMPDKTLYHKVIYESSIDSVHGFPVGLLYSKYVLIANKDLDATGTVKSNLIHKINEAFKDKYVLKKYEKKAEFIINDDITIIIYERIKKVDVKEINYYENLFNEESQKYKDKFYDRLENEKNIIYQK